MSPAKTEAALVAGVSELSEPGDNGEMLRGWQRVFGLSGPGDKGARELGITICSKTRGGRMC